MSEPEKQHYRILICHPELLLGRAIAAALSEAGLDPDPLVVTSAEALLAKTGGGADLAIVADAFDDEPGGDLGELLEALTFRASALPVLVLTRGRDFRAAARALERGAIGSVTSDNPVDMLVRAIRSACEGHVVFLDGAADEVRNALVEREVARETAYAMLGSFTERERIIARRLASGRSVAEMAAELRLSPHTVRAAIRALGGKLGAQGQLTIAVAARELLHAINPPSTRFSRLRPAVLGP